jgi:hypothetical protein
MTSGHYHYKKGTMQLGPFPLEKMRALARQGQIGRSHQISADGGDTWMTGSAFPEIFAAGDQTTHVESPDARSMLPDTATNRGGSVPPAAETMWYYTATGSQQGPVTESQLRSMIELGSLRAGEMVWTEALGSEWVAVETIPRFAGLFPKPEPIQVDREPRPRERARGRRRADDRCRTGDKDAKKGFNGAGLSGFICSIVAIVLLAIPCLVWVIVAESFFWIFNIVVPFTILAIVGLVLSVIGLSKTPRGMATTGTVLGVIALMLGIMALVGWFMLPYRLAMQRRTTIDAFATDIKLEEKNLAEQLARYRKVAREPNEPDEEFRKRAAIERRFVGVQLDTLVKAYDGHVSATAKTSEFKPAFLELGKLRKTIDEVGQAAKAVEDATLMDVLEASNADARAIKVLMDTLKLYERGEISLKQAEAKMTGR